MTATGNLSVEAQARYAYIEDLLESDFPVPARIVELGSAPGDQTAQLAAKGYDATSVDLGESTDDWGSGEKGRMDRLLSDHGVADLRWNLEEVPYPLADADFDAVIMTEVFEHLREYPIRSLNESFRVLRPGGRLYFTTPNVAYVMNRFKVLAGGNVATPLPDWIAGLPHARHAREYTFSEVAELMERVGFRVVRAESRHFYVDSGRTSGAARLAKHALDRIARLRPTLGPAILIVGEK